MNIEQMSNTTAAEAAAGTGPQIPSDTLRLKWLHNLRLESKVVLLMGIMMLPVAHLGAALHSDRSHLLRAVEAEMAGVHYLTSLSAVMRNIALHRGLQHLISAGDVTAFDQLASARSAIATSIQRMDEINGRFGVRLGVADRWDRLVSDWQALSGELTPESTPLSIDRQTSIIAAGLAINDEVLHTSILALDPAPLTYNLIASAIMKIPHATELLGQTRILACSVSMNAGPDPARHSSLLEAIAHAGSELEEVFSYSRRAAAADPRFAKSIEHATAKARASTLNFLTRAGRVNQQGAVPADPLDLFAAGTAAIETVTALQAVALEAANASLVERASKARQSQELINIAAAVMLATAIFLGHILVAGVRHHTREVNAALRDMIAGRLDHPLPSPSPNEFGDVLSALQEVRATFLTMLANTRHQQVALYNEVSQRRDTEGQLHRLAAAVEHAADGIVIEDVEGRIVFANPAFERIIGLSVADVMGRCAVDLGFASNVADDQTSLEQALHAGQVWSGCMSRTAPGRSPIIVDSSIAPIRAPDGTITHRVIVLRDITEQRELEGELVQAQKLEAIGRLAAGIAHEINTPTQYVGDNIRFVRDAFTEMNDLVVRVRELAEDSPALARILQQADLDFLQEEVPKALDQSAEGCQRIATIVKAMKEFSHPAHDKTPVDLNRAIASTITVATNEWKYVADLHTDFDPDLPQVTCLPGEISQVILNMLVNAAHAIADVVGDGSRGKGTITVSTRHVDKCAVVRIADTGTGIAPEAREKIFDPFFTTKAVGRGTGQGLAIAHDVIVSKHHGSIGVESEPGRGATFIIRIPIDAESCEVCDADMKLGGLTLGAAS